MPVPLRETARGSCSGFRDPCTGGRRASSSRSPPRTHSGSRWARGWAYANPDYLVLGLIVEAAGAAGRWPATCSGASRRRCGCAPRAWTMPRASPAPTRTATLSPAGGRRPRHPSITGAAGALVSTAGDFDRFLGALLGGRLPPLASCARCRPPAPPRPSSPAAWACRGCRRSAASSGAPRNGQTCGQSSAVVSRMRCAPVWHGSPRRAATLADAFHVHARRLSTRRWPPLSRVARGGSQHGGGSPVVGGCCGLELPARGLPWRAGRSTVESARGPVIRRGGERRAVRGRTRRRRRPPGRGFVGRACGGCWRRGS